MLNTLIAYSLPYSCSRFTLLTQASSLSCPSRLISRSAPSLSHSSPSDAMSPKRNTSFTRYTTA